MPGQFSACFSALLMGVAISLFTSTATAQSSASTGTVTELGADAVIAASLGDNRYTTVAIPSPEFRVGFYVNNDLSIEPRVSIYSVSGGGSTDTQFTGELGLLYQLVRGARVGVGPYVRPFAGFAREFGSGSGTQAEVGAGVGTKIPFGDRMATRFEANFSHLSASDYSASVNQLALSIGLSYFTR